MTPGAWKLTGMGLALALLLALGAAGGGWLAACHYRPLLDTANTGLATTKQARDYLEILAHYDTLFVDHVPLLGAEKRNETKRFINLVDTVYDHRARLFASAEAAPENLLVTRKGTEGFEFDRTVSRLIEIRSTEYLADHNARYGAGYGASYGSFTAGT